MTFKLKKFKHKISYNLKEVPIDSITVWDEAQARTLDTEDIASLAKSIAQEGLQNPPLVQRNGNGSYLLMSGQRRLEALKRLNSKTIPVLVLNKDSSCDVIDAKAISIIENMHRKDMSSSEMTASCQFLAQKMGKSNAAKALGINRHTLYQHLGFGAVPQKIKEMVPQSISKRDAISICKAIPSESKAIELIQRIAKYDVSQKKRYIDAIEQLGATAEHSEITKLANKFRARQNLSIKISKTYAKGLSKISREHSMEPSEMAQKIVTDYLKRRGF